MNGEEHLYTVADFTFGVGLPRGVDADRLLPSFKAFKARGETVAPVLFHLNAALGQPFRPNGAAELEQMETVFGRMALYADGDGYIIGMDTARGHAHVMRVDGLFTCATLRASWADPFVGGVLSSMLRVVYSQAVLPCGAVSLHAVALLCHGNGFLFMGRSGTGKSTHARLWMESVEDCQLLNDDNPTVRLCGDRAFVYGTPWSGKTPCYRARRAPLSGIVRLSQAAANRFTPCSDVDAFVTVLPGCAVFPLNARLHDMMCDTLVKLAGRTAVGRLECLPDIAAAQLCARSIGAMKRTNWCNSSTKAPI